MDQQNVPEEAGPADPPRAPEAPAPALTIDDVIQATVRVINLQENAARPAKAGEIAALVPVFKGSGDDAEEWLRRVDSVRNLYRPSDTALLLIIISKLEGKALAWFHSKAEHVEMNYEQFKSALLRMFKVKEDRVTLFKRFENRRWRRGEKFNDYYMDKVLLANKLNLNEEDTISYLIDGIENQTLRSQAKMKEFKTLNHMLTLMNDLTDVEKKPLTAPPHKRTGSEEVEKKGTTPVSQVRCYNCYAYGHGISQCTKPKRERGSCFGCGSMDHQLKECPRKRETQSVNKDHRQPTPDSTTMVVNSPDAQQGISGSGYWIPVSFTAEDGHSVVSYNVKALLDTGSPISLIKSKYVLTDMSNEDPNVKNYYGIGNTKLKILGTFRKLVEVNNAKVDLTFHVVEDTAMFCPVLLGRDFIQTSNLRITLGSAVSCENQIDVNEIMHFECTDDVGEGKVTGLNVNPDLSCQDVIKVNEIYSECYVEPERPLSPNVNFEMHIAVTHKQPFAFRPRRLSYEEKEKLHVILQDLIEKQIIRPSNSQYCSPIVLVRKKSGEIRLCVDFRELNKITIKDHYPLPLIDDHLDLLRSKKYFTCLDLKNGFHHVKVADDSIKYTSFITPLGQFEYLRMPFGLCNAPSVFQRFINEIFRDLIEQNQILIYLDDILIATDTIQDHLNILRRVFNLMTVNLLELRLDKCLFLQNKIIYLGYLVDESGIRPNPTNVDSVKNYPIPKDAKSVQRFLGLTSYFRRFIPSFSVIAKPLYDLIRKNVTFNFIDEHLEAFETLKNKLVSSPVLAVYSPKLATELHCDACSTGYGAVLLQKQADGLFKPISYFSKRTSIVESKYHSYELEMLAIINALNRFRIYLQGLNFKIVTDCNSIKLALSKREINPRINRWALVLQNYDYQLEHRASNRMRHVDALSRSNNVLVLEENTFEQNLSVAQNLDTDILKIRRELEEGESREFELRNGLVYKKIKDKICFYVPKLMEEKVIHNCHDTLGHVGLNKTLEYISRAYWFPSMRQKIENYIKNCLKCITYSSSSGKPEGELHNIPKGNKPFVTLHIDHYGPLEKTPTGKKYMFEVIDSFTKYVKLYAVKSTKSIEVVNKLKEYFCYYSKPLRIVSDQGSAFTSNYFENYLQENNILHVKIAVASPKSNGQIERVNRDLTPMLAKLSEVKNKWDKALSQVEYAMNNTYCRSIDSCPAKLLFGVEQRNLDDDVRNVLLDQNEHDVDVEKERVKAEERNKQVQNYNKLYFDSKHKAPTKYDEGDFVMLKNFDVTPNVNNKLIPKYKGPYCVRKVLENDRYLITDIDGFQMSQIPFERVYSHDNMRLWLRV